MNAYIFLWRKKKKKRFTDSFFFFLVLTFNKKGREDGLSEEETEDGSVEGM